MENVAKACSDTNNGYVHHMKKLDEKDSEELFVSKAFGSAGNPCPKDQDFNGTMRSVLKKCGGLPLAIVSIGNLLASYKPPEGKEMWNIVQRSIGSQMEISPTLEGMRQILTLSYNDLPHHLKACMMYLSIFPEDYRIGKDRLLKRWIAEGLVAEKRGLTRMEIAEGYFNELMSRSMIDQATGFEESIWRGVRREEMCKVHDMMLEILVSTSLEANFVSLTGGQYEGLPYTNTVRRLSVHGRVEQATHKEPSSSKKNVETRYATKNDIEGMMVEHVRSLSIFDPEVNNMLLARLGEFTLLRVLDLEGCKGLGKKHMRYICQMYLLRFLSLRGTDIKVMPPSVGDLEHLQTLDVRETDLKDLPDTTTKLEKLEHLLFSEPDKGTSWYSLHQCSGWMIPQGINKMKRLHQLNRAEIDDPKAAEEIGELDQLQELAIYVDTRKEMNPEVLKELARSLSKMYSLRWLEIGNFGCGKWPFKLIMNFLHEVKSPPRLLRYLKICGCIDRLPDWVGSLTDLADLYIAWTYIDSAYLFSVLYKLPNLKRLFLGAYVIWKGQNMVARSIQPFPKLKELILGYSPEVPEVYRFEEGSMPELETLVVNFGDQGKEIVGITYLTNLKEVQYTGIKGIMKHAVQQLEELNKKREQSKQITVRARYEDGG
jgi:disease resistance protein RPM1